MVARLRLAPPALALAGIVAGSAALLAVGTSRVKEWAVMTDELLYAKLAGHIADSGSPLPVLHGEHVGFLGVVYPILLAPFYGTLDPVAAFEAAHVVNAVLFASAAIPTFLLARRLLPTACALAVALLVVALPWAVNAAFVMSEPAAYPVFLWAVLACHVAVAEPSPRRDVLAIGALALAFFTRPQFLFLAAVLVLAVLLVEGPRRSLERHRVLAGAVVLGILVVVPLAALGQAHRLLGDYGVTATEGSLLPAGVWKSAAIHLDLLAVGLGVLPFLLGAGWVYTSLRDASVQVRAFAGLTALALPLLALEAASYDLRFGGAGLVRDRYLFYVAPLLLVAAAAALQGALPVVGIAATTAFFAATVALADFHAVAGLSVDSPVSVLNGVIRDESAGLSPGVFVAVCGVLLGAICVALVWVPRPIAVLGVTVAIFAFCGSLTGYAFERLLTSRTVSGVRVTGESRVRDWIDRATSGRSVALLAYPVSRDWGQSAVLWWDVEFWNDSATRAFVVPGGTFTYTPFPSRVLRVDFRTGRAPGTDHAPPYVLTAPSDSRFGLAGDQVAANVGLSLVGVERPYRARWVTRGLDPDGWTRPGRPATIRVYAEPGRHSEAVGISVTLDAPPEATAATSYTLATTKSSVAPGTRAVAQTQVCVPAGGHADLVIESDRTATIAGPPLGPTPGPPREVGLIVSGVQVNPTGTSCRP
jgi:hypothetical protein